MARGGQGFQGDGLGKALLNIIEHAVEGGHLPLRKRAAAFLYPGLAENALPPFYQGRESTVRRCSRIF